MTALENFAEFSFEEQKKFAEALLCTINYENIFTDNTEFKLAGVEACWPSRGLTIVLEHDNLIDVSRDAAWTCGNEDEVDNDPGHDANYSDYLFKDAKKAFKTLEAVVDGYKVSLSVDDVDEEETVEVNVNNYSHEDSGIGSYEYGSIRGFDSRPYIQVEGTIVKACSCSLSLYVEPTEIPTTKPSEL